MKKKEEVVQEVAEKEVIKTGPIMVKKDRYSVLIAESSLPLWEAKGYKRV